MDIGVVADDITGGTDLASTMRDVGLGVVQTIGVPAKEFDVVDAVVVSQKTRTCSPAEAVNRSVAAARWLLSQGAGTIYFKYCSTFDSTDRGNIGPVTAALLDECGEAITVACPSYPPLGRTVYQGHLFVGDRLLSESPLRDHPLTPMTDSDLVRVLGRQYGAAVGLVPLSLVREGESSVRARLQRLYETDHRVAILDATTDGDLDTLAAACGSKRLITGAAGLGRAVARIVAGRRAVRPASPAVPARGAAAVLSGSCSPSTLEQVRRFSRHAAAREVDPIQLAASPDALAELVAWARRRISVGDILVYSTAPLTDVRHSQATLGRDGAAALVEEAFRILAVALREAGVTTFVVAGGETSGAVLEALGIQSLGFGETIEPGVPAAYSLDPVGLAFALKSGNFGTADFFERALEVLRRTA